MKSIKLQLLVTLVGVAMVVGIVAARGLPPTMALKEACRLGDLGQVKRHASWLAGLHATSGYDETALHFAAVHQHPTMVTYLLAQGADANARTRGGGTPLCYAVRPGSKAIVGQLLAVGVAVNLEDENGYTVLHRAASKGYKDIVAMLLANGADVHAAGNPDGYTPLHCAVLRGHADVAETLLARGANANGRDRHGYTPLHHAAAEGHASMVEVLLQGGASADIQTKGGWPSLQMAIFRGREKAVAMLADSGLDLNAPSGEIVPLHYAASEGRETIVEILIAKGADVDLRDRHGRTPLYWARRGGHDDIADLLRQHGARE